MFRLLSYRTTICLAASLALSTGCAPSAPPTEVTASTSYEDLVSLFEEWRAFEKPEFIDGVPDYTAPAMAEQHRRLADYKRRLVAFDTAGWPVAQQVDHHMVRTEMNGLDFYHRVSRPWARNPAFYVIIFRAQSDVPAHEGPVIHGWIDLWTYDYPLSPEAATELATRLGTITPLLEQAKGNLVEDAKDLWVMGIRAMKGQSRDLQALSDRVAGTSAELDEAIQSARKATDEFAGWLESEAPSKSGPSGVGVDNYTWYMHNVHLVPYTWDDQVMMMRRELARSHATLRLEEHRNRKLPPLERIDTEEEYDRRFNEAVTDYIDFFEEEEILSVRDYYDSALRERIGRFTPAEGLRGFFSEVSYRDPLTMRTHGHHWIDLAMMATEPHPSPIRRVPSLYNIFDSRAEGMATGMEEWMMHAGLFDERPRSRELMLILVAQRAARALGGLMMHANEWTIDEAVEFASKWTPRGWMPEDSNTAWGEQHFYLTQPGYATSYLVGKHQIEELMAERALQLGDDFTLKGFIVEIHAAGVIPMSLIRWELTGEADEILQTAAAH
jgi:hypothetical protein